MSAVVPAPGGRGARKPLDAVVPLPAVRGDAAGMPRASFLRLMLRRHLASKLAALAAVAAATPVVLMAAANWSAMLGACGARAGGFRDYPDVLDCAPVSARARAAFYLLENAGFLLMLPSALLVLRMLLLRAGAPVPRAMVAIGAVALLAQGGNAALVALGGHTQAVYFFVNYPSCVLVFVGGAWSCRRGLGSSAVVSVFAAVVVGFLTLMIAMTWVVPPLFLSLGNGGRLLLVVVAVPCLLEVALLPVRNVAMRHDSLGATAALALLPCLLVNVTTRFLIGAFDDVSWQLLSGALLSLVEVGMRVSMASRDAMLASLRSSAAGKSPGTKQAQHFVDVAGVLQVVLRFSEEASILLAPVVRCVYRVGPGTAADTLASAALQWLVELLMDALPPLVAVLLSPRGGLRLRQRLLAPDEAFQRTLREPGARLAFVVATLGLLMWLSDEAIGPFKLHCPGTSAGGALWRWREC